MDVVEKVGKQMPLDELLQIFNDQGYSDYLVVYCRLVVSFYYPKLQRCSFVDAIGKFLYLMDFIIF